MTNNPQLDLLTRDVTREQQVADQTACCRQRLLQMRASLRVGMN